MSSPPLPAKMPLHAWGLLAALALLWGTSFLGNRVALQGTGPLTIVAFRTGGAALLLWSVAVLLGRAMPRDPRLIGRFLLIGFLNCALPFTLIAWGQKYIPSGLTGILNAGSAVFGVAVAALVFRDERLTSRRALGVTVGLLGVVIAIGPETLRGLSLTSIGQFAIIASSLCYAFGAPWTRRATQGLAPEVGAAMMMTGAFACQVPIMLVFEGAPRLDWPGSVSLALMWLTLACTTAAYLIYFRLLALAGAGNTSLVTLLIPPVAIVAGALTFGERLHAGEMIGFAVIAAGLMILNGGSKPRDGARHAR